jgi:lysozyme family protein
LLLWLFGLFVLATEWTNKEKNSQSLDGLTVRSEEIPMMTINYDALYYQAKIDPNRKSIVDKRVQMILNGKTSYSIVELQTRIPWWCVATVHSLESSLNFHCHLHNGDPLTAKTTHVPRGRPVFSPKNGRNASYTWEESATDALSDRWKPHAWSLGGCLEFLERYNGLGYRILGIFSPYLWSYTDHYTSGLFVKDGYFDRNVVSESVGAAALLKVMEEQGAVSFEP